MINSDRLNDFINNNNYSYISTIVYIITYKDKIDIIRDNEFWDLKIIISTLKYNKRAISIYYVLD